MTPDERVIYAQQMLAHEFEHFHAEVFFFTEEQWVVHVLSVPEADPTGAHKPFGLTGPAAVNRKLYIGLCVPAMIRPLAHHSDEDLQVWLEYWVMHTAMHIVVVAEAVRHNEHLTLAEVEEQVEKKFAAQSDDRLRQAEMLRASLRGENND